MARLTVVDASVLLALFDGRDARADAAEAILAGPGRFAASTFTLAEVLVAAVHDQRLDEQLDALASLRIEEVSLPPGGAPKLARLRARTGLKLPDCCVLLAATQVDADALATRDERLRRAAAELGLTTP